MDFIKRVPLPLSGVMLGAAALGNLLQSYGEGIRTVCGLFAAFMLVLLLLKLIMFPGMIKEDLQNPIMAGVAATFPMALMLLSTYVKPLIGPSAVYIWWFAIALHAVLIVYFTLKFMLPPVLPKVFAVYFIVYVGIAVAAVTAPAYEQQSFGQIVFWFAFICFIGLFVLVTMAYAKTQKPEPAQPLICIYAAPLSLCIAGYVQSVMPKNLSFLQGMLAVASVLYLFAIYKAVTYIAKGKFFPSWAAFTFPMVISAIATKQTMACAKNMEQPMPFLKNVVLVETIIAAVAVAFVFIRFMMAIFSPPAQPAQPKEGAK